MRLCNLLAIALVACGGGPRAAAPDRAPTPANPSAPRPAPSFRLTPDVRPLGYQVRLTIDPDLPTFSGEATIPLELGRPASVVWLHAADLTIERATLGGAPARVETTAEQVAFIPKAPLAAGKTELVVSWRGKIADRDYRGIFRQKVADAWYVFTQFESIEARRAIPCFDEPGFKVPWKLSLRVPAGLVAAGNTPIEKESVAGPMREVVFAETPALPSYLLAFTVGPFDVVDGGTAGVAKTPLRYLVPRGQAADVKYAAATNGKLLALHEEYYGIPYPFAKLDSVAVPGFGGAMENPGLITYASSLMLLPPGQESVERRQYWVSIAAHEIAHQWFGNLVTMSWWDDIWLNEAFASWAGNKVVDRFEKRWDPRWARAWVRDLATDADVLASARRIRQPVTSNDGIGEAFDRITYQKGQLVLEMLESWVGPEAFQKGVRAYLERYARKNATGTDFVRTIAETAGKPEVPAAMATFLDQPGLPGLTGRLVCADKSAVVELRQERYLASPPATPGAARWQLPVCVSAEGVPARRCMLLEAGEGRLELGASRCPRWVYLNAGGKGYYHSSYQPEQVAALFAGWKALSPGEQTVLLEDLRRDVTSGRLPAGEVLGAMSRARLLASMKDGVNLARTAILFEKIIGIAAHAGLEEEARARFVRDLGARGRKLGWLGKPGDSDETRTLRIELVVKLARSGEAALMDEAHKLATRIFAGDRRGIPPEIVEWAPQVAAARPSGFDVAPLIAAARHAAPADRESFYLALGKVRDPEALRLVREFVLSPDFVWNAFSAVDVIVAGSLYPEGIADAITFIEKNYQVMADKLPRGGAFGDTAIDLVEVGKYTCDEKTRARLAAFFGEKNKARDGGPRQTAAVLETIDACIRVLDAQRAGLERELRAANARPR